MAEETQDKSSAVHPADTKPYDPEALVGKMLAGRYRIERCIGRGGMGVVYLAQQSALGRAVVIKVLPREFVDNEEAIIRFEREARGMSRLQHPNVVAIHDFGHDADLAFICMEYVAGETLSQRLRREGHVPLTEFAAIAAQLLHGIGEAHRIGLIHRDIKPSNIMLTERHGQQNYVKILDFGLAKLMKGSDEVTKEQTLVGSAAFLSPEQIMGRAIDHRVDIYAMGVLFYYMLCGDKPFSGDDIRVLYQHVHDAPEPLAPKLPQGHRVPAELVALVERMLEKSPDARPHDAVIALAELTEIMIANTIDIPTPATSLGSGDFPAVRAPRENSLDESSEEFVRNRSHTPSYSPLRNTTSSHVVPAEWESSPSGVSFVTGEQILQIQKEQTRRTLGIALVVVMILGAVGAAIWWSQSRDAAPAQPDAPAQVVQATGPTLEGLRAQLRQVNDAIDANNFGLAEELLGLVEPGLQAIPQVKPDYASARDRLETTRLLSQAKRHEADGKAEDARALYDQLLHRNPEHPDAQAGLKRLAATTKSGRAEPRKPATANLRVMRPRRTKQRPPWSRRSRRSRAMIARARCKLLTNLLRRIRSAWCR